MLKKSLIFALFVSGYASMAMAQVGQPVTTGPVTSNDNLEWGVAVADAATPAIAQTLPIRVRDGSPTATTFVSVSASSCVTVTALNLVLGLAVGDSLCTAKLPPTLVTMINTRGVHNLYTRLFDPTANNGAGAEGAAAAPFVLPTPVGAPTGSRITR